jgi:hypothetical protein
VASSALICLEAAGWLQIDPRDRPMNAAGINNRHERPQLFEVDSHDAGRASALRL